MVNVGIALASTLIVNGISWVVKQIDDYIHRLDIAKEKLSETEDELGSVDSEIVDITARIKELESIGTLSLTDKEELERLREENKELAIRKKYLEDIKAQESEDVVQYTKEKVRGNYGETTSREDIDAYKGYMDNPEAYGSQYYESDVLTIKIAQYEKYQELRKQALEDGDFDSVELLDANLKQLEESLIADRTALQGFKDDLSLTGESSEELDNVNQKLKFIDDLLLAPSENLKNFLNSDAISNDTAKLKELVSSGELTEEQFKQSFSAINSYLEENNLSFQDLISTLEIYKDEIEGATASATKFTKTQMIDTINSMADGFDILDKIYADVLDGGSFDFTNLDTSKFAEQFAGLEDEYTKFIETISNSPNDINACQRAFDELTDAYIRQNNILDNLTSENAQLAIDMLNNMGVANSEEVVMSALGATFADYVTAKRECAIAGVDLVNATNEEIVALINENRVSQATAQGLFLYQAQKALANQNGINTVEDCIQLENLALAAGYAGSAVLYIAKIKGLLNKIDSDNLVEGSLGYESVMGQVKNYNGLLQQLLSTEKKATISMANYSGGAKSASVANDKLKDSTNKSTSALEKQKEALEKNKEALEEQKSEMEELHDAVQWFYDTKIDKIDDTIDKINEEIDLLEKQQSTMDDIIKAIENNYDYEISLIQDKIDALRDANDEEEKALKLEEAKRKLQEAKSRKTLMVYTKNAGFTYQVDTSAIKEAESELAELQENEVVNELEKQIDALEEAKEKWSQIPDAYNKAMQEIAASNYFGANWKDITLLPSDELLANFEGKYTGIQSSIDSKNDKIDSLEKEKQKLEELKSLWEDAKNSYRNSQYEAQLASFFGSDYEYQLLNNSAVWRRKFASEYSSICAEIEALEERIKTSSETTTSSVESGANKIASSADKVREATNGIKFEIDHSALEEAKLKLERLDSQIAFGQQGLETARNAVANFIKEYEAADGCTTITEGLAQAVLELNGIYGNTGDSMAGMISGINSDIESFEVQSRTLSENLTEVDTKMQSIGNSEEQVEETVNTELSNVETTISNLLTKLGELQTKLCEISLSRTEIEAIADEELLDTSTVVDGVHTKVGEIQTAITTLMESITPLEGALDVLMQKLTTLDEVTLSGVIGAFGGASSGEGGDSKESGGKNQSKSSEGGKGESGGGSGLLGAVKAVDEAIGSTENPESLLGKLQNLDDKTLEKIIAQFGLGGENGESEGENLLSAVNAVSQAIVGGKDDDTSLIANIEKLGSDPTIENITTVSDSFQTLHDTINECVKKVEELSKAIESIPSSTATVGVNGGKSSGRAKGGIITKEDAGDLDFVANSLGEDHMVALTEGEAVVPKETVEENPEVVNSLLSGKKLDLKALVNRDIVLQRATPLDNYSMFEKYKDWVIPDSLIMSKLNIPSQDFSKLGVVNNNQKETVVQFNGDIHVHEVQNVDSLSKAIVQQLPRKMTQALSRRDL